MYSVFCIDPPWPKKKGGIRSVRPKQSRSLDYSTMSVDEIFKLLDSEVLSKAIEQHTVFLWTVDEFLHESEKAMAGRGYKRHARIVWDKENGVAPAFSVRFSHEYVVWFYKPKFTPVSVQSRGKHMTVIREKSRQHSRKPDLFYKTVDEWFPEAKKIDVFSREKRHGWDQFGNQTDMFSD
jgi:N6-adenosine-specific RNA methylase IME4